jgi:hypothetical protein
MTIKQQGGIFGRNPTFNDVDVDGTLTVDGLPVTGGNGTMATQNANAVAITGGNIDGTVIGATSQAAISGTSGSFGADVSMRSLTSTRSDTDNTANFSATGAGTGVSNVLSNGNGTSSAKFAYTRYINNQTVAQDWRIGTYGSDSFSIVNSTAATTPLVIDTSGNCTLINGSLFIGTSGKGIDFSATSGTGTSELFSDYEEGTWTPTQGSFTTWTSPTFAATYTKVGRLVTLNIAQTGGVIAASSAALYIGGSPYSAANDAVGVVSDGSINDHGHCVAGGTNIFFSNIIAPEINFIVTITFHVA